MEQRDYLMRQIEQLGEVLAVMLARLLGIKQKGNASLGLEELRQTYKSELDLDVEELIRIPKEKIVETFLKKNKLMEHHLETIAELLQVTGEDLISYDRVKDGNNILEKSLYILEYLQTTSKVYSINRVMKIGYLKNMLKE
ncbi:MAG: hypothetical protein AMS27_03010 [Bacteroides sp. SM23_62_1]|nr:MAG: hypothetical protein AMS27_03010 [Bacteroides sp. SM23_62_1]